MIFVQKFKEIGTKTALFVCFAGLLVGCAGGGVRRGVIAMRVDESTAHVSMGRGEVGVGDHVELFRNVCTGGGKATDGLGPRICRKEPLGHGEILETLGSDYSVVKFPAGTKFSEGDLIERHSH